MLQALGGGPGTRLRIPGLDSGVNPALLDGERNPFDGQHVGRNTVVHRMRFRVANHIAEALRQDAFQLSFTTASFQK
jgi:hypothetical protein